MILRSNSPWFIENWLLAVEICVLTGLSAGGGLTYLTDFTQGSEQPHYLSKVIKLCCIWLLNNMNSEMVDCIVKEKKKNQLYYLHWK